MSDRFRECRAAAAACSDRLLRAAHETPPGVSDTLFPVPPPCKNTRNTVTRLSSTMKAMARRRSNPMMRRPARTSALRTYAQSLTEGLHPFEIRERKNRRCLIGDPVIQCHEIPGGFRSEDDWALLHERPANAFAWRSRMEPNTLSTGSARPGSTSIAS